MTIIETLGFFKKILKETDSKREKRVYKSFITILSNLKVRSLTDEEMLSIESELKLLDLKSNPKNKRKYFSKKLTAFKTYLKEEFSLIMEGYYTAIGMSLGMCFGVAIGTSFGSSGTSMGLAIGMLIGIAIGRTMDLEAEKQNRVLKTRMTGL